jgi:hypothetical protein
MAVGRKHSDLSVEPMHYTCWEETISNANLSVVATGAQRARSKICSSDSCVTATALSNPLYKSKEGCDVSSRLARLQHVRQSALLHRPRCRRSIILLAPRTFRALRPPVRRHSMRRSRQANVVAATPTRNAPIVLYGSRTILRCSRSSCWVVAALGSDR